MENEKWWIQLGSATQSGLKRPVVFEPREYRFLKEREDAPGLPEESHAQPLPEFLYSFQTRAARAERNVTLGW